MRKPTHVVIKLDKSAPEGSYITHEGSLASCEQYIMNAQCLFGGLFKIQSR